eukprot:1179621-Prorocentrum_minimum.AAC.2
MSSQLSYMFGGADAVPQKARRETLWAPTASVFSTDCIVSNSGVVPPACYPSYHKQCPAPLQRADVWVQHRPPPTPGQNGAMLTENEIVHMNLAGAILKSGGHREHRTVQRRDCHHSITYILRPSTDLRIQCRAHGVSPAGSRENLQERLCCALSSGESQERMPLIKVKPFRTHYFCAQDYRFDHPTRFQACVQFLRGSLMNT